MPSNKTWLFPFCYLSLHLWRVARNKLEVTEWAPKPDQATNQLWRMPFRIKMKFPQFGFKNPLEHGVNKEGGKGPITPHRLYKVWVILREVDRRWIRFPLILCDHYTLVNLFKVNPDDWSIASSTFNIGRLINSITIQREAITDKISECVSNKNTISVTKRAKTMKVDKTPSLSGINACQNKSDVTDRELYVKTK